MKIMIQKSILPIGYISTYKNGDKYKKIAPTKWVLFQKKQRNDTMNKIKECGIYVLPESKLESIIVKIAVGEISNEIVAFSQSESKIKGLSIENSIFLTDDEEDSKTPLHEYVHIWDNVIKKENPTLWEQGKKLLKNTDQWIEVENSNPDWEEDRIASEVHSIIVSDRSQRELNRAAKTNSLRTLLVQWLKKVKQLISKILNINSHRSLEKMSIYDFYELPIRDLYTNGEKIKAALSHAAFNANTIQAFPNATQKETSPVSSVYANGPTSTVTNRLRSIKEFVKSNTMNPRTFLSSIQYAVSEEYGDTVYTIRKDNNSVLKLRIADHKSNEHNNKSKVTKNTSIYIDIFETKISKNKNSDEKMLLEEYRFDPDELNYDTQCKILDGLISWYEEGSFTGKIGTVNKSYSEIIKSILGV